MRGREQSLSTSFGRWIKRRRVTMEISQKTLADLAGLHASYVSALENGKRMPPSFDKAQMLCAALGSNLWECLRELCEDCSICNHDSCTCPQNMVYELTYRKFLQDLQCQLNTLLPSTAASTRKNVCDMSGCQYES